MESSVVISDERHVGETDGTLGLGDQALDGVLRHVVLLLVVVPQSSEARVGLITKLTSVPGC